jgi:hypothetical protein
MMEIIDLVISIIRSFYYFTIGFTAFLLSHPIYLFVFAIIALASTDLLQPLLKVLWWIVKVMLILPVRMLMLLVKYGGSPGRTIDAMERNYERNQEVRRRPLPPEGMSYEVWVLQESIEKDARIIQGYQEIIDGITTRNAENQAVIQWNKENGIVASATRADLPVAEPIGITDRLMMAPRVSACQPPGMAIRVRYGLHTSVVLSINASHSALDRIDTVAKVGNGTKVFWGVPSAKAKMPYAHAQDAVAKIRVRAGAREITDADITML